MASTSSVEDRQQPGRIRRHHQQLNDPRGAGRDHARTARNLVLHEHAQPDERFDHANAQHDPAPRVAVADDVVLTRGESRAASTPRLPAQAGCSVCARLLFGEEHQRRFHTATNMRGSGCLQAELGEDRVEVLLNGPLCDEE
jgi:hypothetical protein